MSAEADLRAVLLAHAPLVAVVPAARIAIDAVPQDGTRPYIAFSTQTAEPTFGLSNALLGLVTSIDIQIVGATRAQSITVRELVQDALLAGGWPWVRSTAGYDAENDIEAEVVSVNWME